METRLFINGKYTEARSGVFFPVVNPVTEELICEIQEANAQDVDEAVSAAAQAFTSWSRASNAKKRADLLYKLADLLKENSQYIAELECQNLGKPLLQCLEDIETSINKLIYYGGWADKITGMIIATDNEGIMAHTRKEAVGVVAAIVPWNYPIMLLILKLAPALAAGCTVVAKSSEKTPLTACALGRLIQQAGFPNGVINIVCGLGPSVGSMIVSHPKIDLVSFTGSSQVGKSVSAECAMSMKRCMMELGGKSPLIICKDADIQDAIEITWKGCFANSGQCCVASTRVYVHTDIYDQFIQALKSYIEKIAVLCDPKLSNCTQGPIVDKIQFERVLGYIQRGLKEGANCVSGGKAKDGKGYWILPTIFTDLTDDMSIGREEIFGPVVCVFKYDTYDEVLRRANDSLYGLGAGVCTKDMSIAEYFTSRLRVGTVWINTYLDGNASIPFGGYKISGKGREGGYDGLQCYLEVKAVVVNVNLPKDFK